MNSYFNQADFNPGGKYGPDAEAMQDRIDQASPFNVANSPYSQNSFSDDKWKDALLKGMSWLSGTTGRSKYTSQAQRQNQQSFMPQSGGGFPGGGSGQLIAPDTYVWNPPQLQQSYAVDDGESSGGGVGSKIGGALGTVGGALIGGPFGASVGGTAGSLLGGLFG